MFIARQAARPTGLVGRALGAIMAMETRTFNDQVLGRLAIAPGERVLEIGFGHGRTLERAARAHPEARFAGIDHADDMVKRVVRRCSRLVNSGHFDLRAGDSSALPWADGSFDAAFAVHTLYFWKHPERDLTEIGRVLRVKGRLILGFRERTAEAEAAFPPPIYRFHSKEDVLQLMRNAGFSPTLFEGSHPDLWIAAASRT